MMIIICCQWRVLMIRAVGRKQVSARKPTNVPAEIAATVSGAQVSFQANIGLQRRGVFAERRGTDVKQRAVADLALVHLAVLLQTLDDQQVGVVI